MSDTTTGGNDTPPPAPPPDPAALAAQKEAQAAASIGAQIILDFNDDTSKGARGGAGATLEENTAARDAGLIGFGLDPLAPSGPPPTQEQLAARKAAADAAASASPQFYPPPSGHATKMSSLAAGIDAGDVPAPPDTLSGGSGV
jgi:hypothetical protein